MVKIYYLIIKSNHFAQYYCYKSNLGLFYNIVFKKQTNYCFSSKIYKFKLHYSDSGLLTSDFFPQL
jgi:hypothetical protein